MFTRTELPPAPAALKTLLPDTFISPRYGGASLANVPPAIGQMLGVTEGWAAPAF